MTASRSGGGSPVDVGRVVRPGDRDAVVRERRRVRRRSARVAAARVRRPPSARDGRRRSRPRRRRRGRGSARPAGSAGGRGRARGRPRPMRRRSLPRHSRTAAGAPTRSSSSSRTAARARLLVRRPVARPAGTAGPRRRRRRRRATYVSPTGFASLPPSGPAMPGHRRGDRRPEPLPRALRHRPRDLGADRAVGGEDGVRHAEQPLLRLVRVRDHAAGEVAARAGDVRDRVGDEAARAGLRQRRRVRPRPRQMPWSRSARPTSGSPAIATGAGSSCGAAGGWNSHVSGCHASRAHRATGR